MTTFWMNPNDAKSTAPILVYPKPTQFHTVRLEAVAQSNSLADLLGDPRKSVECFTQGFEPK